MINTISLVFEAVGAPQPVGGGGGGGPAVQLEKGALCRERRGPGSARLRKRYARYIPVLKTHVAGKRPVDRPVVGYGPCGISVFMVAGPSSRSKSRRSDPCLGCSG